MYDSPTKRSFSERHENVWIGFVTMLTIVTVLALFFGLVATIKTFGRYQRRADANNQVTLNEIQIKQTGQLVQVQKQKAQIRIEEAKGIAKAQELINGTLTPLYLQHEAIQSQESQSNKIIYVPSGAQGIPLVQTVNPQ